MSVLTCLCNPIGDIAVDPASGTLIATHPRDCTVSIFDAEDSAVVVVIRLDGDPVAVAAAGGRAFVATTSASYDAASVLDMDSKTVLSVHPLAFTVTGLAVQPDGARMFAARTGRLGSDVAAIDLVTAEITSIAVVARGTSSIALDERPSCIATSSAMRRLYVADHVGDVTVVPTATPMLQAAAS